MSNKAVYRTAPATPGLLIIIPALPDVSDLNHLNRINKVIEVN